MTTENSGNTGTVLHHWRTTVLNGFLTIAVIISVPALAAIVANAISKPAMWPTAIAFSIVEIVLIAMAVFRRLPIWLRVGGFLLVGYAAAALNLAVTGLAGAGSLYLVAIPVLALILIGRRAGLLTSVLSALLATVAVVMIDRGLLIPQQWTRTPWMALTTTLMFLTIVMTLLILFYRFQERLIDGERRAQVELVRAHGLLEAQNVSLEQKVQERTEELAKSNKIQTALYKITDAASTSRDMEQFCAHVHHIVGESMFAENLSIALYDENTGLVSCAYQVDEREDAFPTQPLADLRGMSGYILRTGNAIRHGADYLDDRVGHQEDGPHIKDGIGVPLEADGKILGAISLRSYTEGTRFTDKDDEALGFEARHVATAMTRLRALDAERQRTNELAILSSVSQAMTETLDVKTVTRIVGDKLRDIFGADSAMIMLLDKHTNLIHPYYEYDENEGGYIDYVEPFPLGKGLASRVISTRQPLMLGTLEEEIANGAYFPPEIIEKGSGFFSESWLGVPIVFKDDVLGLVALADARAHAFSGNHLRILQTLSSNVGVAIENARLFQAEQQLRDLQQIHLKDLERELDIGREIQRGFLPSELPRVDGWEIAECFKAAREVAGDFYDTFLLPKGNLVCVVGDVCGKGVGAALFMTLFRSLIRATSKTDVLYGAKDVRALAPAERLHHVMSFTNSYIAETHGDASMFAAVFIGVINLQNGTLTYINGGNEPALVLGESNAVTVLPPTGPVVGIIPDAEFSAREVSLETNDVLLAFTDGIPDALSAENESFGTERLRRLLSSGDTAPRVLLRRIEEQLFQFIGTADQFDDITLLAIKRGQ